VGLIQRLVEEAGIPTISMGNVADRMVHIKPPRALLVKFARGSMFGEPGNVQRHKRIILDGLQALQTMTEPGTIRELPYRWKQPDPELKG
jgi:D-proline reductase (dithiol) PrdB